MTCTRIHAGRLSFLHQYRYAEIYAAGDENEKVDSKHEHSLEDGITNGLDEAAALMIRHFDI